MSDDLSKLTPHDPSAVDPDWTDKRQGILDGVLAANSSRQLGRWRWVAGVAAAALVAVGVGGLVQQLRPEPYATPASPTPTSAVDGGQLFAARDTLLDTGTGMTLCNGHVMESRPPQCPHTTPVTGISWEDVPWAKTAQASIPRTAKKITWGEAIIVGTFDADAFVATQVFRHDDPAAPQPPERITDEELPTLCAAPMRGTGGDSIEALIVAAENLPGYQALWVSSNQVTYNVAVAEDVEGAQSALAEVFGGELCVGTVGGPTDKALKDAQQALKTLMLDVASATTTAGSVWSASSSVSGLGNRLEATVARDTPELLDKIESAVGPEVWAYTDVVPFFYPAPTGPPPPSVAASSSPAVSAEGAPMAVEGTAMRVDGQFGVCYGEIYLPGRSDPTGSGERTCLGGFLPVAGLNLAEVGEFAAVIVGTWDGSTFDGVRAYEYTDSEIPRSPRNTMPPEPPDVCEEQTGTGTSAEEELNSAAAALPGYQGLWLTTDMSASHYRVAVTHGVEEAQTALLEQFGVLLCVATVPGPDEATLRAAEKAVMALWPRKPGELEPYVSTDAWAGPTGMSLQVAVLDDTDEIRSKVMAAVGPEAAPYTKVIPVLFPVDPSALETRVVTPTPMPPGPATPLVITATDRQRAGESVASDLQDADGTSASAKMAKATFEQYEALWSIDVPYPPGPPPGDTEILVVTLSASLSNRVMHGRPLGGTPGKATGTLNVIEARTGTSIIYATLLGDEPEAERITQFPGPIEDVALPEGFQ